MKTRSILVTLAVVALAGGGVLYGMLTRATQASKIRKSTYGKYEIEIFENSETLSAVLAINKNGAVIGSREASNEAGTIFHTEYFFSSGEFFAKMPIPEGYTNVEAVAISDNDLVVGYASRPLGSQGGSLHAVIWNPRKETVEFLPIAAGDSACQAQAISADGSRITGYSTGPERLRPVLWGWSNEEEKWSVAVLPTVIEYNPYLMSSSLRISPDGKNIVGCCTEKILPGDRHDSSLYGWQQNESGDWERRMIHEEQLYVRGLNNQGETVGSVIGPNGRLPCYVSATGDLQLLELLPGDVAGEARGINSQSQIVGWSDEPPGTDGGPKACMWSPKGAVTQVHLSEIPYSMLYGINDSGQLAGMLSIRTEKEEDSEQQAELALGFRTVAANAAGPASEKK
jgi:uncharacterized membrane protein